MIDYIITNSNVHPSRILDVKTLNSSNTGTNHNLVLMKMRGTIQRRKKIEQATVEKLNVESLSDDSAKYLYQQRLKQSIDGNRIQEEDDVHSMEEAALKYNRSCRRSIGKEKD